MAPRATEDLPGAGPETLAVVEYLSDNLAGCAAVLVVTVRAEPCAALDLARAATRCGGGLIELSALSDDEIGELAADRLGARPGLGSAARAGAAEPRMCPANPLMAEEILNDLIYFGRPGPPWGPMACGW
ncbi:MAG: hypothetical protein ACM30G_19435 [Micromonosporaceae bacterium]